MISISYNNKDITPLKISDEILSKYKEESDIYLVDIRRELTRSLVDYRRFQELQKVNNDFFSIIHGLYEGEFTSVTQLNSDKSKLVSDVETLLKSCKSSISSDIYSSIRDSSRKLMLTINKLIQIVITINEE